MLGWIDMETGVGGYAGIRVFVADFGNADMFLRI